MFSFVLSAIVISPFDFLSISEFDHLSIACIPGENFSHLADLSPTPSQPPVPLQVYSKIEPIFPLLMDALIPISTCMEQAAQLIPMNPFCLPRK
jgi:hypothetical protein